jgi:hypothetical protein
MKFLVPVTTASMLLIPGVVYGQDFDGWCATHYGNVGKPWAICGKAEYLNDDPKQGISRWSREHLFFFSLVCLICKKTSMYTKTSGNLNSNHNTFSCLD